MKLLQSLRRSGQSVWLDGFEHGWIRRGALQQFIEEDGLRGVRSNFDSLKLAIQEQEYDRDFSTLAQQGTRWGARSAYDYLIVRDLQLAADLLKQVHAQTQGRDGYVQINLPPEALLEPETAIAAAQTIWRSVGLDLDKRTAGAVGASRSSPHSLLQELLKRSDAHLWAFVSNGRKLRILGDNVSLTRQSFVEFDLEAMMAGEVYADFVLLWLLCHQSRVETEKPEQCWLEQWSKTAQEQGTRALDQLRRGVEVAIATLGQGFLSHVANRELRQKLQSGQLSTQDYYRQLLRLVYRLLFLFVVEDRGFLLDPKADVATRERYTLYYSTARLRTLAEKRRGTRHADLFLACGW